MLQGLVNVVAEAEGKAPVGTAAAAATVKSGAYEFRPPRLEATAAKITRGRPAAPAAAPNPRPRECYDRSHTPEPWGVEGRGGEGEGGEGASVKLRSVVGWHPCALMEPSRHGGPPPGHAASNAPSLSCRSGL